VDNSVIGRLLRITKNGFGIVQKDRSIISFILGIIVVIEKVYHNHMNGEKLINMNSIELLNITM
jgi:hypothetical protein